MTKKDTYDVLQVLLKIKKPDGKVEHAIKICEKQLAYYQSQKGQMKQTYDYVDREFY